MIDGPFRNEAGIYHLVDHCDGCNNGCAAELFGTKSPDAVNAVPECRIVASSASCDFGCKRDHVDMDGRTDNGCEFTPDPSAIYVATSSRGGDDTGTCGD